MDHAMNGNPVFAGQVRQERTTSPRPASVHEYAAIAVYQDGSALIGQRDTIEVRQGDLQLIPAGEAHRVLESTGATLIGVGFCPACLRSDALIAPLLKPFDKVRRGAWPVLRLPGDTQQRVADLVSTIERETAAGAPKHAEAVVRSLLTLLLAEVARLPNQAVETLQGSVVGDALAFIEDRCLDRIGLGDVADAVGRSPAHLTTMLGRATGRTVTGWIISCRMAEARTRLLGSHASVEDVAEAVGYADPTAFIRQFRRAHGSTPAAWRAARRSLIMPVVPGGGDSTAQHARGAS
jgi:AraC-like DNA-binding protein